MKSYLERLRASFARQTLLCLLPFLWSPAVLGIQQTINWSEIERLREQGQSEEALQVLPSEASPEWEQSYTLRWCRTRFNLLYDLQRLEEAQTAGLHWISVAESGGDALEQAESHYNTGRVSLSLQGSEQAGDRFRAAYELVRGQADPDLELLIVLDLAATEIEMANYSVATPLLGRAEELWRRDRDPRLGARLWGRRATLAAYQGNPTLAMSHRERQLELALHADNPDAQANAFSQLGWAQMELNDYAGALISFQRYMELDKSSGMRSQDVIPLVNTGICHFEMNQFDDAKRIFEDARRVAVQAGSQRVEAWTIGELGLVVWKGDHDAEEALSLFEQSVRLFQESKDPRNALVYKSNIAMVHRDLGNFTKALELYGEIERETLQIPGQQVAPQVLKGMGESLAGLERYQEAEEQLRMALVRADSMQASQMIWRTNWELAKLYRKTNDNRLAEKHYRAAVDAIESARRSLRLYDLKADFFQDKVDVYGDYIGLLVETSDDSRIASAFALAERAHARSLLDSLAESRAAIHETLPPELRQEEEGILSEISALQLEMRQGESSADLQHQLHEREEALESFYLELRENHPRFQAFRYPEPVTLEQVRMVLHPGEWALEYFVGDRSSYLWVIDRQRIRCFQLPGRQELESVVQAAYTQMINPESSTNRVKELGDLILGPIGDEIHEMESILVVPSGILHYVPFEVLTLGLGESSSAHISMMSYWPSASTLVHFRNESPEQMGTGLLAVGDAEYASNPGTYRDAALEGLRSLGRLPYSRDEIRSIQSLFGRSNSTLLMGPDATESTFKKQELGSYSVIHLATHGWIDASSPSRSGLVLGIDPGGGEDGILQVREIFKLPLKADLVTLSACQTALGRLVTGEGMVGLCQAFFYAGARTVLASLWSVNDETTSKFMAMFYDALRTGLSKAEALRQAKLQMRQDPHFSHPFYWAPYVLIGDGSQGIQLPPRDNTGILGIFMALIALAVVVIYYRRKDRGRLPFSALD